jgi:hypothetical protein
MTQMTRRLADAGAGSEIRRRGLSAPPFGARCSEFRGCSGLGGGHQWPHRLRLRERRIGCDQSVHSIQLVEDTNSVMWRVPLCCRRRALARSGRRGRGGCRAVGFCASPKSCALRASQEIHGFCASQDSAWLPWLLRSAVDFGRRWILNTARTGIPGHTTRPPPGNRLEPRVLLCW